MPIFILAQGRQRRLQHRIATRKQLLEVNGEPILARTIRLCRDILPATVDNPSYTVVIGWPDLGQEYAPATMPCPGNCILDGIREVESRLPTITSRRVYLLGDVVFSRAALTKILNEPRELFFAATPDLGRGSGEVFALSVAPVAQFEANLALNTVSCRGLDVGDKYQPGHLRNLLWRLMEMRGLKNDSGPVGEYHSSLVLPIDDWTDDIDTPNDVDHLPELGKLAREER